MDYSVFKGDISRNIRSVNDNFSLMERNYMICSSLGVFKAVKTCENVQEWQLK